MNDWIGFIYHKIENKLIESNSSKNVLYNVNYNESHLIESKVHMNENIVIERPFIKNHMVIFEHLNQMSFDQMVFGEFDIFSFAYK
jgi:hypothetical protein